MDKHIGQNLTKNGRFGVIGKQRTLGTVLGMLYTLGRILNDQLQYITIIMCVTDPRNSSKGVAQP